MATVQNLMGSGMPGLQAGKIGTTESTALTATGSAQGDALQLVASWNKFSTVGASTGCILPKSHGQPITTILNGGSNALSVYPATGETINAIAANSAFSLTNAKAMILIPTEIGWIGVMSA